MKLGRGRDWPAAEPNTVESSPAFRRYLMAAAAAAGSARNWDHSVRPVLAELVELAVAERLPVREDRRAAARALLGPELWAWVDPREPRPEPAGRQPAPDGHRSEPAGQRREPAGHQPALGGREAPGPGRDALRRILDRLEEWGTES